jgi:hypothetical protein
MEEMAPEEFFSDSVRVSAADLHSLWRAIALTRQHIITFLVFKLAASSLT